MQSRLAPKVPHPLRCTVCCLVAAFLPTISSFADVARSGPVHSRVVWKSDPTSTATISWDTHAAGQSHRLLLREEGAANTRIWTPQHSGRYSDIRSDQQLYFHHVRLTDLQPATRYFVTLESDGQRTEEMYFLTAPADQRPFAILFGGDSRSGHDARQAMNRFIAGLVEEQQRGRRPEILALAHGGDFVQDGRKLVQWLRWLRDHELTIGADGRLLPIIPARGNHDVGQIFNEAFDFPSGDRNFYAMSFGQQLRWITLNTETSAAGDQQAWLARELASSRPMHRWVAVQYHKPAFPAVKIPSGAYPCWVPLFEQHDVDLVCEADGHCIKRTPPLRQNQIDPTGVVYIGEGGLGVGQRTPRPGRWYLDSSQAKVGSGHHLQMLTWSPDRLLCQVILLGGEVFDEHPITPRELRETSP